MMRFKNIFKKKEPLVPFLFSGLVNDIHSHLIPGIDDGVKTLDDSVALAKGMVKLGYKKVVTTPHIMSDYYRNTPEIILSGLQQVNDIYQKEGIDLSIEAAAEYYVDFDFIEKIGKEKLLTFGDNYILIECSFIEPPKTLNEGIFELQTNGYKPILAHPERYLYWHNNKKALTDLKDRDVLFQTNLLSLAGIYSPEVAEVAEWLIQNKMIDWLGTDLHNAMQLAKLEQMHIKSSLMQLICDCSFLNKSL